MRAVNFKGATSVAGEKQGYVPLPIMNGIVEVIGVEGQVLGMANQTTTVWVPDEVELAALNAGGGVRIGLLVPRGPVIPMVVSTISADELE